MLSEPGRTEFDLSFTFFGFDVRVHPGFFLMGLLIGNRIIGVADINPGVSILLGTGVIFISILIHEIGHALAFQYYGIPSRISLYLMGGLAIPESAGAWGRRGRSLNNHQQIIVSLAGPAAGFLLAAVLVFVGLFLGQRGTYFNFIPCPVAGPQTDVSIKYLIAIIQAGLYINIFWGLLNLIPVFPLDGGQAARSVFQIFDLWDGTRKSLILSIGCAALGGVWMLQNGSTIFALMCFYLAYQNYQSLNPTARGPW